MLWNHAGCVGAPPIEAMITTRRRRCVYTSGEVRSTPLLAPLWVTRIIGAPSKGPPTTPWLARNSSTMPWLNALKSMSLMGGDGIGTEEEVPPRCWTLA